MIDQKNNIILNVKNLNHYFHHQKTLDNLSFCIKKGDIVGLIGRSGAGKSTLMRCLCSLEKPTSGSISLNGKNLTTLSEADLVKERRHIGLVFQHFNILHSQTIAKNITLPLKIAKWPLSKRKQRLKELLNLVGLSGFENKYPSQLSGGQKQRVGIARALANNPDLLLCDEATSALDPETTDAILTLLEKINKEMGVTIILITHEMEVIKRIAQKIIVLDHGKIIENGTMSQFLRQENKNPILSALLTEIEPQIPNFLKKILKPYEKNKLTTHSLVIIHVILKEEETTKPIFVLLSTKFNIHIELLQGGVTTIGEMLTGDMILGISGENTCMALSYFKNNYADKLEVLGYVPDYH